MKALGKTTTDADFEQRFARIEGLLEELSASADPLVERVTREVLATVLELHQRGLSRLLELSATNEQLSETLTHDPRVSAMLLLHGLHPLAIGTRVARTVDRLRQRFHGKFEEVTVDTRGGLVAVRVVPAGNACSSTRAALKRDFEEALLTAAPDAESVLVEFAEPAPALVTLRLHRSQTAERVGGGPR